MIEAAIKLRQGAFALDVAFTASGGITALFGRSGTGKSTILALLAGTRRPDQGRIHLHGRTLVDTDARIWLPPHKRRIGFVFQDGQLFPHLTVHRNLLYGRRFGGRRHTGIDFDAVVATLGIEPLLPRHPLKLSGGEKQRVAIGRALLANPELLLMDEPLASLDMARKVEILALVERVREDFAIPIVYVSHSVEEVARLATTVVILEAGRVVAEGPPSEVIGPAPASPAGAVADRFVMASVLDVDVGIYDQTYGLTALHHPAGRIFLSGSMQGRRRPVRVVIRATDVALATEMPHHLSIRNVLRATVSDIAVNGSPVASVRLALEGDGHLTALATRHALDELGLTPGKPVFALLKSVALDERPIGGINAALQTGRTGS